MAAGPLSRLGLGMKTARKDANALLKMGAVTSMAKNAYDLFHKDGKKLPPWRIRRPRSPSRTRWCCGRFPTRGAPPTRPALTAGPGTSDTSGPTPPVHRAGAPHGGSAAKKAISAGRVAVNVSAREQLAAALPARRGRGRRGGEGVVGKAAVRELLEVLEVGYRPWRAEGRQSSGVAEPDRGRHQRCRDSPPTPAAPVRCLPTASTRSGVASSGGAAP